MKLTRTIALLAVWIVIGAVCAVVIKHVVSGGSGGYTVRAVFNNSSFVIPGEEVQVAGVTVGTIKNVDLTRQNKAAVVLQITDPRYIPFKANAHCEIDLESLLGEQNVECSPGSGTATLTTIQGGPDAGQHLLGVQNTTTPVGFDLLQDIYRLPEQQGLQLIISGLGAGLTNNGKELNEALLSADPALQSTDRVISVLADQNKLLAALTDDSAKVLGPLAAQSKHIGGFIDHAGSVAVASADESRYIEQNLKDFPAFLRQLKPATKRLAALAEQITPALKSLNSEAPSINAATKQLGPLAKTSIPTILTLGTLAKKGETVFPKINTVARQLLALSKPLQPVATDIAAIAKSFDDTGGIEDVMRFIYYYAGTVNGEDSLGHYMRTLVTDGGCSQRTGVESRGECSANFSSSASSVSAEVRSLEKKIGMSGSTMNQIAEQAAKDVTGARTGDKTASSAQLGSLLDYLTGKK